MMGLSQIINLPNDAAAFTFKRYFFSHYLPVREAVSYRGLFTAGWFGMREKHGFRLEIYDRLRASEQAVLV